MTNSATPNDVIIAGGGIAGASVAAALAEFGYRILIVEPGMDYTKRLAGELIHPPGVGHLFELGLLSPLLDAGGVSIRGFAIFPSGNMSKPAYVLPYSDSMDGQCNGLAIEHATMACTLLDKAGTLSKVTVWKGARISAIDVSKDDSATVEVEHAHGRDRLVTSLLVAADGRTSHLRTMAGISHKQIHVSNMIGYVLRQDSLPHADFGHVFIGGPSPVLAYPIGRGETRVMFDRPLQPTDDCVNALPPSLRSDVVHAMETQAPLRSANFSIVPEVVVRRRLVCVGDAGGCCHPLTATGLSACTRDAILLRNALREAAGDIPRALRQYARWREGPQRTRMAGADLLYSVFRAQTPEMRLMRQGLFRYWQRSPVGRTTTIALLSTQEGRLPMLVREYAQVWRHSLAELIHTDTRRRAMFGLSRELLRFVGQACLDSLTAATK